MTKERLQGLMRGRTPLVQVANTRVWVAISKSEAEMLRQNPACQVTAQPGTGSASHYLHIRATDTGRAHCQ